ncbi:MAG: hypothetical protein CSA65_05175 [Proteobacteria bacterium]|nr:MAG: hypothetical protein CSA65_05175 [Pseudomonadota bacterium]
MPKILTCCYCGTRAALILDKGRHELVCASCGAPLHQIKQMPGTRAETSAPSRAAPAKPVKPGKKASKKRKKKKASRFFDEVWDVIDDIFD